MTVDRNIDDNYCFFFVILAFPVVCDIDFIVITGNILRSVNDIPIVKPGISLYRGSAISPGSGGEGGSREVCRGIAMCFCWSLLC